MKLTEQKKKKKSILQNTFHLFTMTSKTEKRGVTI